MFVLGVYRENQAPSIFVLLFLNCNFLIFNLSHVKFMFL